MKNTYTYTLGGCLPTTTKLLVTSKYISTLYRAGGLEKTVEVLAMYKGPQTEGKWVSGRKCKKKVLMDGQGRYIEWNGHRVFLAYPDLAEQAEIDMGISHIPSDRILATAINGTIYGNNRVIMDAVAEVNGKHMFERVAFRAQGDDPGIDGRVTFSGTMNNGTEVDIRLYPEQLMLYLKSGFCRLETTKDYMLDKPVFKRYPMRSIRGKLFG